MEPDEYIWYSDDKNKIYSAGYPINNIFKALDMPAIKGSCHPFKGDETRFANLAIPAGLVYMHTLTKPFENEQTPIDIDMQPTSEDLYSKLLSLVAVEDKKVKKGKTRKRRRKRKNKSRKK